VSQASWKWPAQASKAHLFRVRETGASHTRETAVALCGRWLYTGETTFNESTLRPERICKGCTKKATKLRLEVV
jgi:hypothetical protein